MGIYLNPGNDLFYEAVNSDIYVDKSMLIDLTNKSLRKTTKHICISRPRRFGKSMAANMLAAYYDRSCDLRELFRELAISETPDFEKHLNKYNVFQIDVREFASGSSGGKEMTDKLSKAMRRDLFKDYKNIEFDEGYTGKLKNGIYIGMPIEEALSIDPTLAYNEEEEDYGSEEGYWMEDNLETEKVMSITIFIKELLDDDLFFTYEWAK